MANKCSGASAVVSLAFLTILLVNCVSSEIVGGHVYWKQVINKKIQIMYRLQWEGGSDKYDYTGKGTKRQEGDIYICDVKTSKKVALLYFQNLVYNPYRKWTVGGGTTKLSLKTKAFKFYLAERCISPFLRLKEPQTSKWSIYFSGNLTLRSGNKSPVPYMNPVVPFRVGCYPNIKIPVHDNNHDIQCRWPSFEHGECVPSNDLFSNVLPSCDLPRGATLNNCKLKFEGTNKGTHMLTVMVEARQDGHLQSKVPVQFTVEIIQTKKSECDSEPSFDTTPDTWPACFSVLKGNAYSVQLSMKAVRGESIIEVESIMPSGMNVTARNNLPSNVYELAFHWPGKYVMPGTHPVCFLVTRTDGFMSRQQCIDIIVYSEDFFDPDVNDFHVAPPTKENNFKMTITFNFEVKVPSKESGVMLLIAKTMERLKRAYRKMEDANYKEFNKKQFKVYDLAKQTIPVSLNPVDKYSLILDLDDVLRNEAISESTRFFAAVFIKEHSQWSLIKYPPCSDIRSFDDGLMYFCGFNGKSPSCFLPKRETKARAKKERKLKN